ncbi:Galactose oxidase [Canna indica]|uniref:Galactose oxidase n=1 Tax=Canna indica TaxID=4628 RepID=A0AAQ3Q5B6_9LILI|nr:Galactose oxidase [Canna indica]
MEPMPMPRTNGDMLILPNAELLIINGGKKGCAGWYFGRDPALEPVLYRPTLRRPGRFRTLRASTIPRMYHSTSAVLPDTSILVSGSNPNNGYKYTNVMHKTELSVERFYPPYFDPLLATHRPQIDETSVSAGMRYGQSFWLDFILTDMFVEQSDITVTMYAPPFTTHGYSMNQRLLILAIERFYLAGFAKYRLAVTAPASGVLAPPGYYLVFVVNRGIPSTGIWVQIQ